MSRSFPSAVGMRLPWRQLPAGLRQAIERELDAPVLSAVSAQAGFSPAFAGRVTTEAGAHFIKATGADLNPDSPAFYAQEARIAASLPEGVPAPRLQSTVEWDSWIALVFEHIDGHNPVTPWRRDELDRVLGAVRDLSGALTPAPIAAPLASEHFTMSLNGFGRLLAEPLAGLDAWTRRHLERLAELEARAPHAARGETLLHFDLRADNIVLTADRVYFVDWPWVAIGAPWIDVLGMAPSITMQGGSSPEEIVAAFPAFTGVAPDDVSAVLASLAGFFTRGALQPPPPGLPTLRPFQAAQGEVARAWLARRMGWE